MRNDSSSASKRDQGVEAKDFAKPNLDLSGYMEEDGLTQTFSVGLQTGDSIRGSRPSKSIFEERTAGGNQNRPTNQSKESELSFGNNKTFTSNRDQI